MKSTMNYRRNNKSNDWWNEFREIHWGQTNKLVSFLLASHFYRNKLEQHSVIKSSGNIWKPFKFWGDTKTRRNIQKDPKTERTKWTQKHPENAIRAWENEIFASQGQISPPKGGGKGQISRHWQTFSIPQKSHQNESLPLPFLPKNWKKYKAKARRVINFGRNGISNAMFI